jgi:hypothetical protein
MTGFCSSSDLAVCVVSAGDWRLLLADGHPPLRDPFARPELHNNEMVFAAKGIKDELAANGGFLRVAVGNQLSATLDISGTTNKFGGCAESAANEEQCSLTRIRTTMRRTCGSRPAR